MDDEVKIRVYITKGSLVLAEFHSLVNGGRHEFVFGQPIRTDSGRHFGGFSLECWLDQVPRHVQYERQIELPFSF